jgi:hypothetical protein
MSVPTEFVRDRMSIVVSNSQPTSMIESMPGGLRIGVVRDFRGWLASIKPWAAMIHGPDWVPAAGYIHWWKQHARQAVWEARDTGRMALFRYEDLVLRKADTAYLVARAMGLVPDVIELQEVCEAASLREMQADSPVHVRRGDPFGWRDELCEAEQRAIWVDEEGSELMFELGYSPSQSSYGPMRAAQEA